jgi:SAM-dependent methyltransferase
MPSAQNFSSPDDLRREPWAAHARQWGRLGPPLRPCPEDLQRLADTWRNSLGGSLPARRLEILLLGVTPEIAVHSWADDFFLTAIDATEVMLRAVWPGDGPRRRAFQADWLRMPFPPATFDLVLSDCGLAPLSGPGQLEALGRELRRVLRADGRVVMRHFARPANPEPVETVIQAVATGLVANFHELKLRLLMALPADPAGVCLGAAWQRFQDLFPDRKKLAKQLGCPLETIGTIDAYQGRDARYVFPPLLELVEVFTGFTLTRGVPGTYPLAPVSPVFALTPKP